MSMLATSLTLTAALMASQPVDVRSSTNCPSSKDIAERLRPLLPEGTRSGVAPDIATVDVAAPSGPGTYLRVRLRRAHGAEVGDRRVPLQGDCSATAATIAAVLAAWEIEPLAPAPTNAGVTTAATAATAPTASTWRALAGAGGGIGMVGGVVGLVRLEALAGKTASRAQARLGFAGQTMRTTALSTGQVDWRHTTFEASVLLRTLHPTWSLSVDAGVVLGWATLEGRDFAQNRQQRSFEYGAVGAMRLTRAPGRWSAWVETRAHSWLRGQRASLPEDRVSLDLPLVDVTACVGLSAPVFW